MVKSTQQKATDFAFGAGLTTAPIWCGAQIIRAYTSTSGVSLAQYFAFIASFLLSLNLALGARKKKPGRVINQQIIAHSSWSMGSAILIAVVLLHGNYHWTSADTRLGLMVLAGITGTFTWKAFTGRKMTDPAIRGLVSISLKALPQFLLVPKILAEGGAGFHWSAILMGNVSILTRLIPLYVSIKNEGMSAEKWWLLTQDALNEASWAAVTVVWFMR